MKITTIKVIVSAESIRYTAPAGSSPDMVVIDLSRYGGRSLTHIEVLSLAKVLLGQDTVAVVSTAGEVLIGPEDDDTKHAVASGDRFLVIPDGLSKAMTDKQKIALLNSPPSAGPSGAVSHFNPRTREPYPLPARGKPSSLANVAIAKSLSFGDHSAEEYLESRVHSLVKDKTIVSTCAKILDGNLVLDTTSKIGVDGVSIVCVDLHLEESHLLVDLVYLARKLLGEDKVMVVSSDATWVVGELSTDLAYVRKEFGWKYPRLVVVGYDKTDTIGEDIISAARTYAPAMSSGPFGYILADGQLTYID